MNQETKVLIASFVLTLFCEPCVAIETALKILPVYTTNASSKLAVINYTTQYFEDTTTLGGQFEFSSAQIYPFRCAKLHGSIPETWFTITRQ